jgi:uncharacterized protein YukE
MSFEQPMAVAAMNNKVAATSDAGECWDVIGAPLDDGVNKTVPGYDSKLDLHLDPASPAKRGEISELKWGRIDKDAARLEGLAAAIENISSVVKKGKDQLAHDWKGESFDAFRGAMDKVEKTLNDYAAAAKVTAKGLHDAMTSVRTLYGQYQGTSTGILAFNDFPKPDDWFKIGDPEIQHLKECSGWYKHAVHCGKEGDTRDVLTGKALKKQDYDWYHDWDGLDHDRDARTALGHSDETKGQIEGKIHEWYTATDNVKTKVGDLYKTALENLRIMAELKVFSTMLVPAQEGEEPPDKKHPGKDDNGTGSSGNGNGSSGNGHSSTGGGGGTGSSGVPINTGGAGQTDPSLAGVGKTDPAHAGTGLGTPGGPGSDHPGGTGLGGVPIGGGGLGTGGATGLGGTGKTGLPGQPKEVTIQDGKNKITVGQPDARGRSKLTVDDGTGKPKTYDLDFGDGKDGEALGADGELVHARPDGKAVIHDGQNTITAERVPGDPNKLKLTMDDGTPPPKTYTVDFDSGTTGIPPGGTQQPAHSDTASAGAGGSGHGGGGGGSAGGGGGGGAAIGGGGGGGGSHDQQALDAGMATKAEAPGSSDQHHDQAAAASAGGQAGGQGRPGGQGMPMGGMGGAHGGGQGGDQTRTSKWRTQGQLFEEDDPAATFNGIVGEDPANRVSRAPKRS